MSEKIAILGGTGKLGYALALRLGDAGHSVIIGSRDEARARAAAARAGAVVPNRRFRGENNVAAATLADRLVIVAVPFASQLSTLKQIAAHLRDHHIILDATVPLGPAVGGKATHLLGVWSGSAAQQARSAVPENIGVVSGLHTLSADLLAELDTPIDQDTLLCGDRLGDKDVVREILGAVKGLRVVDAGPLDVSRLVEGFTPVLIGLNIRNRAHTGIRVLGLQPASTN